MKNRLQQSLSIAIYRSGLGSRIALTSLIQVLTVAEYLNFRNAASALRVSQSSVSARVKALEETLGILLFERRHRGVRLTEAGRRFVAEVSIGIDHLDQAVRTARAVFNGAEGRLAIGLHTSVAFGFLADLRRRYRVAYPKIEQIIAEGKSSEMIAMVRDGKLDVAFVVGAVEAPDCHSREFWHEQLLIVLPADHALASTSAILWSDLASETFLIRNDGAGPQVFEHVVRRVVERERSPHTRHCDVGRDTLMHMVAAGEGITLANDAATHVPFPGVVFRPIVDEAEQARFRAVWSPHNRNPALKNLLDLATEMKRSTRSV